MNLYEKMTKEGWRQTDASTNQYRKDISDKVFLFREDRIIHPITKETELFQKEINLEKYTLEQIYGATSPFGYEKDEVDQWISSGENLDLIAECIFEFED